MEPRSKRLVRNAKNVLAMGIGLLMTSVMLLGFYLAKPVKSSEPLFFSVMFLAYALISFVMYGSIHSRSQATSSSILQSPRRIETACLNAY